MSNVQKEWLIKFVSDMVHSTSKPVHLTNIAPQFETEFPEYLKSTGLKIKQFIETIGDLTIYEHDQIVGQLLVVPKGFDVAQSTSQIKSSAEFGIKKKFEYEQDFWDAFWKPVMGDKRFVLIDQDGKFKGRVDIMATDPTPDGGIEILNTDIKAEVGLDQREKINNTKVRLENWLHRNGIDGKKLGKFTEFQPDLNFHPKSKNSFYMFEKIDQLDKSRILIPLDIVEKMFKL